MNPDQDVLNIPKRDLSEILEGVGAHWDLLRGKTILITGGTGFVGKWMISSFIFANRTLNLNAHAIVLTRNSAAFLENFPELQDAQELTWLDGDVRNFSLPSDIGIDFVIHAATDVVATNLPSATLSTCILGTQRVLDQILSLPSNAPRTLFVSSGAVYGAVPSHIEKVDETWIGAPDLSSSKASYGEGKRISELLAINAITENPDLNVSIARCFTFVGPHLPMQSHFAIGNFISSAINQTKIEILGDGTPLRSYLYASELAKWLWILLFIGENGEAYNVGSTDEISIEDLASKVATILAPDISINVHGIPSKDAARQAYVPSIQKISDDLELQPKIGLDEAIKRTGSWLWTQKPVR